MRDVLARYRSALRVGAAICLALLGAPAYAQTAPSASFRKLVSSNGFAPVVYDVEARRAVSFREHLYRYPRAGLETRELLYDLYLGLRTGSSSRWMTDVRIDQAGYVPGTGLIRTEQRVGGLLLSTTYFSPFELEFPAFVAIGRLENTGADTTDVALFSIHNFHLGGGADRARGESIRWDAQLGAYIESSAVADAAQGGLLIAPLGVATHHQASPMNPYGRLMAGQLFEDVDSSGVMDDAVSGFQFDVAGRGSFAAGAVSAAGLVAMYVPDRDFARAKRALDAWVAGRDPVALVTDAETEWQRWRDSGAIPASTDPAEARVATQALATLRMAQSREAGAPNGQIVASIAPGHWDITWLRDATYAIRALIETHHYPEAERALDFLVRGPFNTERARVGRDYGVSICRYYGSGAEETDFNGNGPNVELDGFGLYLDVASAYAKSSTSGAAWLRAHHGALASGIAEVLLSFKDAETGLVAAESSIWESHWDNGARQRWVFTSGSAVIGLSRFASALEEVVAMPGDTRPAAYRARVAEIRAGMESSLVDASGALAASVEQLRRGSAFADAQAALILAPETFTATSAIGRATLDFLRQNLFLSTTTRNGYRRNDDGDLYDRREWLVVDLAISTAVRAAGRPAEADALLRWITGQAALNFDLIPELFDENDGRYAGETPMVGFGAGAYVTALIARSGLDQPFPGDAGVSPDAALEDAMETVDAGVGADGGSSDAEPASDAARSDTGQTADAGRRDGSGVGPAPAEPSGCGCSTTEASGGLEQLGGLACAALALLRARTSRARRPAPRRPR